VVGNEPFAVLLADDLLDGEPPVLKQMVDLYAHYHSSVIGVQDVPREETSQYGIVDAKELENGIYTINAIVEKPGPRSSLYAGVVGRYILTPRIFKHLAKVRAGAGGEIQLTDGIASLLHDEQVLAYAYKGIRYDCGSKLGYLKATIQFALKHPEVNGDFRAYLSALEL